MTPATAKKGAARYRYYVSAALHQGRNSEAGAVRRVPAAEIEAVVLKAITDRRKEDVVSLDPRSAGADRDAIEAHIHKVVIKNDQIEITLHDTQEDRSNNLLIAWSPPKTKRAREVIAPSGVADPRRGPSVRTCGQISSRRSRAGGVGSRN
jgi:hypothetical protein